jgi:hypothetical protein
LPSPSTAGLTNDGSFSLAGLSTATIQPGIYTSISVAGNARLTMNSGVYIIAGGGFSVSAQASVIGSGVMIFNAGSNYPGTGGTYGSITLRGNAQCSLSPPTSGTYAGIVLFQPDDNTNSISLSVTANASGTIGTIYAPSAQLSESGSATLGASLVVDTLTISSDGNIVSTPQVGGMVVVGSTAPAADSGGPGEPAASPTQSYPSSALWAWDLALEDASTTSGGFTLYFPLCSALLMFDDCSTGITGTSSRKPDAEQPTPTEYRR